ncbi:hypothetical protein ED733_008863 [Metarhizium rileyi]|uniref:Zn(2)-C6 fungal-type domain-containing protein n=1 Tax=Metarhizium rileyi (strain RCEF 4871) TaxID=1649241 RepID=A0A5C6GNL5_METRR|nr:hypothetical protein ED733_008863 [Metarhizium rileyi]
MGRYRGCDNCRKWKKKPKCSLCARKNLPCEGVGKQRFKFKHQSSSLSGIADQQLAALPRIARSPSNDASRLVNSIIGLFEARHPGHNLSAIIRTSTVQHIGHSPALDASLTALVSIVDSLAPTGSSRLPLSQPSNRPLQKYTSALGTLRESLGDPSMCYQRHTLLAVFVLSFCHMWMVDGGDQSPGHMDGLAHFVPAVMDRKLEAEDQFADDALKLAAIQLLRSSVFNSNIQIYPWIFKVFDTTAQPRQPTPGPTHVSKTKKPLWPFDLYCLDISVYLMIPQLLRRPRENMKTIELIYYMVKDSYPRCVKHMKPTHNQTTQDRLKHGAFMKVIQVEAQSLHVAIGLTFNAFLRAFCCDSDDVPLADDRITFCADAIELAEQSKSQLPLSAHHVPLSTIAAWCVAEDESSSKARLRQLLEEYRSSYAMVHVLHSAPYWREAPEKLSREIPWFPKYNGDRRRKGAGRGNMSNDGLDSEMYEYCCIL